MLKKDEKLKSLEASVSWLRNESVNLVTSIERLTENNKNLTAKLQESQEEVKVWHA
jgi:peptidoglycan hydrolase CwlO-like protein